MSTTKLGVIGGGTMGAGIVICAVRAGLPTVVHEMDDERAQAAAGRVRGFLEKSVERGKLSQEAFEVALQSLTTTTRLSDLGGCDILIEAIYEDLTAKQNLFGSLDDVVADDALLVTNTSTLSVSQIAAGSRLPERVVGMHFCNPAPLMPLIEVVRGLRTGEAAIAGAVAFADLLGKRCVHVRDTPGFLVNRFLLPFENDCITALDRGVATVEEIDLAVTAGMGYPMGPFALLDTVGLDIHHAVSTSLYQQLKDPRFAPPPLVDRMIAAGHLGRKSGRGFYRYDGARMFGT